MTDVKIFEDEFADKNSPDFLRVTKTLKKLKEFGCLVERMSYNRNDSARRIVEKEGLKILPMTFVNNFMMFSSRYPTDEELRQILDVPDRVIERKKIGCCCISGYE
ncbi:MAG: arsenic metallochaperone ArsD family protein, partial [Methanocorpusculum sp.]|nr:arsenic metallochaperone ArsD family protein [Methanocorpusculum sp.]